MKARSIGNKGSSSLEIIIALAIAALSFSAVIVVLFGNQSALVRAEVAQSSLQSARLALYNSEASSTALTLCKSLQNSGDLSTFSANTTEMGNLGGDCDIDAPSASWQKPQIVSSTTISQGKPTAIDVLNGVVYLAATSSPYFYIVDHGSLVQFVNGFSAGGIINSLDAVELRNFSGVSRTYVFAAMSSTSSQLKVIDVTDVHSPAVVATRTLSSCVTGSFPQGWRVFYYGNSLYLTTRETAGPEFHIFNVADPTNPVEFGSTSCKGFALNDTVNALVVHDQQVGTTTKRFAYLATDESDKELRVLDVTNPGGVVEVLSANVDLPSTQNAESLSLLGNTLYLGRQSSSGPELYAFDISNPLSGVLSTTTQEIGASVMGLRVVGSFAYLFTAKSGQEFQVWDVSHTPFTKLSTFSESQTSLAGADYEDGNVFSTTQATDTLDVISSP
jgi:type II secretory pathway pseudopilin PulG